MSAGLVLGGRYELLDRLGAGGFGSVWRARDTRLRRDVAVKVLHAVGADVPRFEREAQALAQLNHSNIVTAHDYGVDAATAYLVLELVRGRSLAEELQAARDGGRVGLAVADVLDVAVQVLDGLAAAHSAGFVHRDLKPHNLMRASGSRTVKIVDFGITHASELSRMTASGAVIGTLPYMAPEQFDGEPLDGRTDLYALGCVLHELLAGDSPYRANTPASWIQAHHFQTPTPVRAALPDIPAGVDMLIGRLLAKSRDDRPADAGAARDEAARLHGELAARARPSDAVLPEDAPHRILSPDAVPTRPAAERPPAATTAAQSMGPRPGAPGRAADTPDPVTAQVTAAPEQPTVGRAEPRVPMRPTRRWAIIAVSAVVAVATSAFVWWADHDDSGRRTSGGPGASTSPFTSTSPSTSSPTPTDGPVLRLTGHTDSVTSIAWSPDGMKIASGSKDTTIRIWDAKSGDALSTISEGGGASYGIVLAWSPDSTHIASGDDDGNVRIWDARTGHLSRNLSGHTVDIDGVTNSVYGIAWSPDGTQAGAASNDGHVRIWDATTGRLIRLITTGACCEVAWSPNGSRIIVGGTNDGTVDVLDARTGRRVLTLASPGAIGHAAWAPDSSRILTTAADGTTVIRNAINGRVVVTLPSLELFDLAWSPDGRMIAAESSTQTIFLWDAATGATVRFFDTPATDHLAWSPDNTELVWNVWGHPAQSLEIWRVGDR